MLHFMSDAFKTLDYRLETAKVNDPFTVWKYRQL